MQTNSNKSSDKLNQLMLAESREIALYRAMVKELAQHTKMDVITEF